MACITKRRDRWIIDFYDQYGKRRWKTLPKNTTIAQAKIELRHIENSIERGVFLSRNEVPLFQKVAEDWLEHKKLNLRETTWEVYQGHVRNHFKQFRSMKIDRINVASIEKFIDGYMVKEVNINTIRKIIVSLNQIFSYAVRHRYIDHNPVREAERPKGQGVKREKVKTLTPEQANRLIENTEDRKYRILFMLAVLSGAREGELLGLKWSDIDWVNNQIHIQRTFNNGRFFDVKTRTSNRRVDLGPAVMTELKKWKLACLKSELDLVFPNNAGNPINNKNMLRRYFRPALEAVELPKIRFHTLRHTFASIQLARGGKQNRMLKKMFQIKLLWFKKQ